MALRDPIAYPGPPTQHRWNVGDITFDPNGTLWSCTKAGTPPVATFVASGVIGGAKISGGSGAPTIAGAAGDRYMRTDTPTTTNQREYICTVAGAAGSATWVGIL